MSNMASHLLLDAFSSMAQHTLRRAFYGLRHPRKFRQLLAARGSSMDQAIKTFFEHKCIFVHIPKCAGNAVEKSLWGKTFGGHHTIWHYQMVFKPREFERFFKFTVVRNPWDRLVSAYFFMKKGGMNEFDKAWARDNLSSFQDFDSFVKNWVNEENIQSWIHFRPQSEFVCLNGILLVDYVAHMENLAADYQTICDKLGLSDRPLLTVNAGQSQSRDYRQLYSDSAREIVARVYRNDIEIFNYDFDGNTANRI